MANQHKGEVEFEADGRSYKLRLSANAYCELEDALGKDADEIIQEITSTKKKVSLKVLRVVFWKALEDCQEGTTFDEAKRILKTISPIEMGVLLGHTIRASMPDAADGGEGEESPPQPGGQSLTGPASTETGPDAAAIPTISGEERPES
jgi:hypothetical protein